MSKLKRKPVKMYDEDGNVYGEAIAEMLGMNPLVLLLDITHYRPDPDGPHFVNLEDVAAWHEERLKRSDGRFGSKVVAEVLRQVVAEDKAHFAEINS